MEPDFAMVDDATLALVDELDRVLDGDNMVLPIFVGMIDQCRQRGGLAAAGRARHQDETLVQHGSAAQDGRKPQILGGEHFGGNLPEDRPAPVLLLKKIGPEARHAGNFVPEVHVAGFFEQLDLGVGGDLIEHPLELVVLQNLVLDPLQLSVDTQNRLLAGHQVKVRRDLIEHELKKRINFRHRTALTYSVQLGAQHRSARVGKVSQPLQQVNIDRNYRAA